VTEDLQQAAHPPGPPADPLARSIARAWWYLPGITLGSMAASALLSPAVAWLVGIPFGWRLLTMSLVIPLVVAPLVAHRIGKMWDRLEVERQRVRLLTSLLPVCAWCRKIDDGQGGWLSLEDYLATRLDATATHAMCPTCLERHFPER
jgi:uncharacterized membrane protein YraQ (UPF0718 family)